jgi:hypothetical protein
VEFCYPFERIKCFYGWWYSICLFERWSVSSLDWEKCDVQWKKSTFRCANYKWHSLHIAGFCGDNSDYVPEDDGDDNDSSNDKHKEDEEVEEEDDEDEDEDEDYAVSGGSGSDSGSSDEDVALVHELGNDANKDLKDLLPPGYLEQRDNDTNLVQLRTSTLNAEEIRRNYLRDKSR